MACLAQIDGGKAFGIVECLITDIYVVTEGDRGNLGCTIECTVSEDNVVAYSQRGECAQQVVVVNRTFGMVFFKSGNSIVFCKLPIKFECVSTYFYVVAYNDGSKFSTFFECAFAYFHTIGNGYGSNVGTIVCVCANLIYVCKGVGIGNSGSHKGIVAYLRKGTKLYNFQVFASSKRVIHNLGYARCAESGYSGIAGQGGGTNGGNGIFTNDYFTCISGSNESENATISIQHIGLAGYGIEVLVSLLNGYRGDSGIIESIFAYNCNVFTYGNTFKRGTFVKQTGGDNCGVNGNGLQR